MKKYYYTIITSVFTALICSTILAHSLRATPGNLKENVPQVYFTGAGKYVLSNDFPVHTFDEDPFHFIFQPFFFTTDFTVSSQNVCAGDMVTITYTGTSSSGTATPTWSLDGANIVNGDINTFGPLEVSWPTSGTKSIQLSVVENNVALTPTTMEVVVAPLYNETAQASIYPGQTYTFGTQMLTAAGTYMETFQSIDGCDSVVNLTLSIFEPLDLNLKKAIGLGNNDQDAIMGTAFDAQNNLYVTGSYGGTDVNFNPNGTAMNRSSNSSSTDIFIAKYDKCNALQWVHSIGGPNSLETGLDIDVDAEGNVYVVGYFEGANIDFDPGVGTNELTAEGQTDGFVAKFDTDGAFQWAFNTGGSAADMNDRWINIAVANNAFYLLGLFQGMVELDPGAGSTLITTTADINPFMAKYDLDGNLSWGTSFTGNSDSYLQDIAITPDDNIVVVGQFKNVITDLDPLSLSSIIINSNISPVLILAEFDSSDGQLIGNNTLQVSSAPGNLSNQVKGVTVDPNGHIYATGVFSGRVDFNPGAITNDLTSDGDEDAFIVKYDEDGDFIWVKQIGGSSSTDVAEGVAITNGANYLFLGGNLEGTDIDFDPNGGTFPLSSTGKKDFFLAQYDYDGNLITSFNIGGAEDDVLYAIDFNSQMVALGGSYVGTNVNFHPTGNFELPASGANDKNAFAAIYGAFAEASFERDTMNRTICLGDSTYFAGRNYKAPGLFSDTTFNLSGCDSIVFLELKVLDVPRVMVDSTICEGDTASIADTLYTTMGTFVDTATQMTFFNGRAVAFDGIMNRAIVLHNNILNITDFTLEAWVKTTQSAPLVRLIYKEATVAGQANYLLAINNGKPHVGFNAITEQSFSVESMEPINDGRWHHLAGVYNSTEDSLRIYVDGILKNTAFADLDPGTSTQPLHLGGSISDMGFFAGELDEVAIFNQALTTTEICEWKCMPITSDHPQFEQLAVYYQFDEPNDGGTMEDSKSNVDGSLQNGLMRLPSTAGCDSIITLNLTVIPTVTATIDTTICEGDSLLFDSQFLKVAGTYNDTLMSAMGCDSIVTVKLNVIDQLFTELDTTICFGDSVLFAGTFLKTQMVIQDTLQSINTGCDSIIELRLRVSDPRVTVNEFICEGDSVLFGERFLMMPGTYVDTFPSILSCDSIVTFNLIVRDTQSTLIKPILCEGDSIFFNGAFRKTSGTYLDTLQTFEGCDSLITMELDVRQVNYAVQDSVCRGELYRFGNLLLGVEGDYENTFPSATSLCDSVVTLTLKVVDLINTNIETNICPGDTITFNGNQIFQSGLYKDTVLASSGCDTIIHLTVNIVEPVFDTTQISICEGDSIMFNGSMIGAAGSYSDTLISALGCDSIHTIELSLIAPLITNLSNTICEGDSVEFQGTFVKTMGVYIDTLKSIQTECDSIVMLNLQVTPTKRDTIFSSICEGDSIAFQGTIYKTTGFYSDTLTSSMVCDSIISLDLTVLPPERNMVTASICAGDSIQFGGNFIKMPGVYMDTLIGQNSCDSIVSLTVEMIDILRDSIMIEICAGESYDFGGTLLTEPGMYFDTLMTVSECDSIVKLTLSVDAGADSTINAMICEGSTYQFGDTLLTAAGTYLDTIDVMNGCDTIVTLNLMVQPIDRDTIVAGICVGETFEFDGLFLDQAGLYADTLMNVSGCDSIIYLDLTVHPEVTTMISDTICGSGTYNFNGRFILSEGTFIDTIQTTNGCDSIITLELTRFPNTASTIDTSICEGESFLFNGQNIMDDGTYTDTIPSSNGCDSIITLNLEILPSTIINIDTTICSGTSFIYENSEFTQPGRFAIVLDDSAEGCDSTIIINLSFGDVPTRVFLQETICEGQAKAIGENLYFEPGVYVDTLETTGGCDSIITLDLSIKGVSETVVDTSFCQGNRLIIGLESFGESGTYRDTLPTVEGCDSIVIYNLEVFPSFVIPVSGTICPGESFELGDSTYTTPGFYRIQMGSVNGCDSVLLLRLDLEEPMEADTVLFNLCMGDTVTVGDVEIFETGLFTANLTSEAGCDSTVVLNVVSAPVFADTVMAQICDGDSLDVGMNSYTKSGIYVDTLQSIAGCDSVITLQLLVTPVDTNIISATICEGENYAFGEAALTETGIYQRKVPDDDNGCENLEILSLVVSPSYDLAMEADICLGSFYLFDTDTLRESGTYTKMFTTIAGCDSLVSLTLRAESEINKQIETTICAGMEYILGDTSITDSGIYQRTMVSSGGCDSIVNLTLTVLPVADTIINDTICDGDIYTFGDRLLRATGTYEQVLMSSNGCDSTITLNLVKEETKFFGTEVTICEGEVYDFNGNFIDEPGLYQSSIEREGTCDSIITLRLNVLPVVIDTINRSICVGDSVIFGDQVLKTSGVFREIKPDENGCDQITVLNLDVSDQIEVTIDGTICSNDAFNIGNSTYNTTGTFMDTISSAFGCDSIITLNLTVTDTLTSEIAATICDGERFNFIDTLIDQAGIYSRSFMSSGGCDSIVTLDLTVLSRDTTFLEASICDGENYVFDLDALTETGVYFKTFNTAKGDCDSMVVLNLTVDTIITENIVATICKGSSYPFGDQELFTSGQYFDTYSSSSGCDSIVSLTLNVVDENQEYFEEVLLCTEPFYVFGTDTLTTSGVYRQSFPTTTGCDSIVNLLLDIQNLRPAVIENDPEGCVENVGLIANLPEGTSGVWSSDSQAVISDPSSPVTTAMELDFGLNTFVWTLSTTECPSYSSDSALVSFSTEPPVAINDTFNILSNQFELASSVVANDQLDNIPLFEVNVVNNISDGSLDLNEDGTFVFNTNGNSFFQANFTYELVNTSCTELRDTAMVLILAEESEFPDVIGITPNDDGINDRFRVPELLSNPAAFPDNEIFIYNRWGDEVFYAKPYENDWKGTNKDGKTLPAGSYFYVLRLNTIQGVVKEGVVVIVR